MKTAIFFLFVAILAVGGFVFYSTWDRTADEPAAAVVREAALQCGDGTALTVQYLEDEHVVVTLDGVSYELAPAVSASGARYANDDESFVFWNQGDTSMVLVNGEVTYTQCRPEGAEPRQVVTDPIHNYTLAFALPDGAEVSETATGTYRVLYAGPDNEPPALTDGYTVTMTLLQKSVDTSFDAFVNEQVPTITNATVTPEQATFFGRDSFQFTHESELGTTVIEQFVLVDAATVARISVSAVGPRAQQYRDAINTILESVAFNRVGGEAEDMINIEQPADRTVVTSPLTITGEARGPWYFEASFPVVLTDWDGRIIAEHYATADGEWMTEEFVPFSATLEFESPYTPGDPEFMKRGFLILQKANPSGIPENDAAIEIPVRFAE